jgi:hypothetical protein
MAISKQPFGHLGEHLVNADPGPVVQAEDILRLEDVLSRYPEGTLELRGHFCGPDCGHDD